MLVPRSVGKLNLKVFKNINLIDMLVLIGIFLLVFLSIWFIPNLFNGVKVIIIMFLSAPLIWLVLQNKKHNCKNYRLIFRIFDFKTKTKTHKINLDNNRFFDFVYEDGKNYLNNGLANKELIVLLNVAGLSVESFNDEDRSKKYKQFEELLNKFIHKCTIIKVAENENLSTNINYFKNYATNEDVKLNHYLDNIKRIQKDNRFVNKYYLIIYYRDESEKNNSLILMKNELNQIGLTVKEYKIEMVINKLKQIYFKDNLALENNELNIKLNTKYLEFNSHLQAIQNVSKLPFETNDNWIKNLFYTTGDTIIHLNSFTDFDANNLINKSIINSRINMMGDRSQLNVDKENYRINVLENLSKQLITENTKLFHANIYLINRDLDNHKLTNKLKNNKRSLSSYKVEVNDNYYLQVDNLIKLFNINKSLKGSNNLILPSDTIASGWPFYTGDYNDGNLFYLGISNNREHIFFDQFKLINGRKNYNSVIMGTSGSGKSTFAKKMLSYQLSINNNVIIVDPENEYSDFAENFNGTKINLYTDSEISFNPLEIINRTDNYLNDVNQHATLVIEWFKILYPWIQHQTLLLIEKSIKKLYPKDESELINWPTITDLINELDRADDIEIVERLNLDFGANGKFEKLYNKQSSYNLENKLTVINVKGLYESNNRELFLSGIYLILNVITNKINQNRNDKTWTSIFLDEAHLFIDDGENTTLNFIYKLTKRIRKYNGAMMIATQNPSDFTIGDSTLKKTQAILANTQYGFFFNLKSVDVDGINQLFKNSGGINKEEKEFLLKANRGEMLLSLNSYDRKKVSVIYSEKEKEICFQN